MSSKSSTGRDRVRCDSGDPPRGRGGPKQGRRASLLEVFCFIQVESCFIPGQRRFTSVGDVPG